jgi:hypothetical protein
MRVGGFEFFASDEECRALVEGCRAEGVPLDGLVSLVLPTEQDGTLLLGSVSFEVDEAELDEARRIAGILRGMVRELGDHRVLVRSAGGKVRPAPTVRATDGARELADLGWELRQAGVDNIEYVIG